MKITLEGTGILQEFFGKETHILEFPEVASILDLLSKIEEIWGSQMPAYLWDYESHHFRGPVVLVVNNVVVRDLSVLLKDNSSVQLVKALAGG